MLRFSLATALILSSALAFAATSGAVAKTGVKTPIQTDSAGPTTDSARKASAGPKSKAAPRVLIIPIEEQVDFGLKAFLERALEEAKADSPDVILFKVNTYGGELHSAFDIVDLLMGVKDSTYAYVEQKAISAGALISLAANRIAMGNGTTIGDCAPITQSQEGIVMLGEKIQSPLRAKFRTLAERNGYPSLLTEAMVTADIGVVAALPADSAEAAKAKRKTGTPYTYYTAKQWEDLAEKEKKRFKSHKNAVGQGQLATFTDRESQEYGLSQGSYESIDAFIASKGWKKIGEKRTTWSENMVRTIGTFAPILMLLGFGALYLEFKTPGLSVFGLLGLLCLGIVFGSKYAVGLANHTELLLLLAGAALFLAEIYLFPGTFIAGSIGLVFMMIALILSLQDYTLPDPDMPWELADMVQNITLTVGMAGLALLVPLFAIRFILPRLPEKSGVVQAATLAEARVVAPETRAVSVGFAGVTRTALRPTGKAAFGDHTYEVSSRGEFIEAGAAVEVVRIEGNKVVVRPKESA
jgi:membrane-bound serine protease (ClpP class)